MTLLVVVFWQGDRFFKRRHYDGPGSVTVYAIDTSGSQRLSSSSDARARLEERTNRLKRIASEVGDSGGVLIVTNFAAEATGVRKVSLDLSDRSIKCETISDQGDVDQRCSDIRMRRIDRFAASEFAKFLDSVGAAGGTDLVNGAFVQGATTATAYSAASALAPRTLVIESDFVETSCPALSGQDPLNWPAGADGVGALTGCLARDVPAEGLANIELIPVQLANDVSIAQVNAALDLFLDFCDSLGTSCEIGS